jgi:hypothetical protein
LAKKHIKPELELVWGVRERRGWELTDVGEGGVDVDVKGDLSHVKVEEDREVGGAGGRKTEAGRPRDQHLSLCILPLRRRCRCHSRDGGKTRFLRKMRGLAQRIYVLELGCPCHRVCHVGRES